MARPAPFAHQPAWTAEDDHALLGLYVKGVALTDLAAELDWSERTIGRAMVRLDLPRRPRGRQPGGANSGHCDKQARRHA